MQNPLKINMVTAKEGNFKITLSIAIMKWRQKQVKALSFTFSYLSSFSYTCNVCVTFLI